jgi:hypothetical protein
VHLVYASKLCYTETTIFWEMFMSATIGYDDNYVLNLAVPLAPAERERLVREVETVPKEPAPEKRDIGWVEYTVPGEPMISPERLEEIKRIGEKRERKRSPEELEESRKRLLAILLSCPVMTDEELQGIRDARKEINECRLAYL